MNRKIPARTKMPYSSIKPARATPGDPYRVIPIPPRSVVREAAPAIRRRVPCKIFRIGYYGQNDGLDCIWLVNDDGVYEQTTTHDYLFRHYDILMISAERSLYGRNCAKIPPIRK